MHEISQSARFLGKRLGPLLKTGLPLMKNLLKTLATSVKPNTIRFNNRKISNKCRYSKKKKKKFGSGRLPDLDSRNMTLIISNEEMNDVIKIIKSLEESGLLIKRVSETIKNAAKVQKRQISQYVIRYIMC